MYLRFLFDIGVLFVWEDTSKSHIEILINNENWYAAQACLLAYIEKYGEDYWAKNFLKLVEDKLSSEKNITYKKRRTFA